MKLPALKIQGLLAALSAAPALGITDTWDGGGTDNFVSTGPNWADNSAPASNLTTTDLIFGGATRLTPNFPTAFQVNRITFNNTAGNFNLTGVVLTIGAGGVTDNDTGTQTISPLVIIGTPATTINAAAGGLSFQGGIVPNDNTITCTGTGSMSMRNLNGSGTLTTFGTPTVTIQASTTPISADIGLNGGTLQIGATGITQTFASTSTVTLFGNGFDFPGGNLAFLENSVFDAGAQLNRSVSLFFGRPSVAAGKTLTFQGGSDFNITGDYIFSPDCDIVVTGAGSQMVTSGSIFIAQSAVLSVQNGGLFNSGALDVGQTGSGDLFVNGPGSAMTVGARTTLHSGTVTFSNEAQVNCSPTSR